MKWDISFLSREPDSGSPTVHRRALIILNQPFSLTLLYRLWGKCQVIYCADGGANRLYDITNASDSYLPDAIIGDLDSLRGDVRDFYAQKGVTITRDNDQNSTDLMKCMKVITEKQGGELWEVILLGGLAGRLDQTIHTLSYLQKLRRDTSKRVFAITDDNLGWVLDAGEHTIQIDHSVLGKTCGLLPVGIDSTVLTTRGLEWNLTEQESSFDGLCSTSNHLVPSIPQVYIRTTKSIWWTVELHVDITVLYFASALTAVGISEETISIPMKGFYLSSLPDLLVSRHPATGLDKILATSQWSVREEMVDDPRSYELTEGAEVAIICPVSGG